MLGQQQIELWEFAQPGLTLQADASSDDASFQHFAIVVADMDAAYGHLASVAGWSAISTDGPQRLPESSGGVTAFKFRDPEGHPLELLAFPRHSLPPRWRIRAAQVASEGTSGATASTALGVDHTAIVVADAAVSIKFYEELGFRLGARSHNTGAEQARLDGLADPDVGVVALQPTTAPPHLELLCYTSLSQPVPRVVAPNDVAATRTVVAASGWREDAKEISDPDGHRMVITPLLV